MTVGTAVRRAIARKRWGSTGTSEPAYGRASVAKARWCRGARQRAFDDMGAANAGDRATSVSMLSVDRVAKVLRGLEGRRSGGGDGDGFSALRRLRPTRAARSLVVKFPNPATVTVSPLARASVMAENMASTAAAAARAQLRSGHDRPPVCARRTMFTDACGLVEGASGEGRRGSDPRRSVRQMPRIRACAHHRVRSRYIVTRNRSPNARAIRISVEKVGLRFAASAL